MSSALNKHLKRLCEIADDALDMAVQDKERFQHDAINWGDLKCIDAEFVTSLYGGEHFRVLIEEASPRAGALRNFVRDHFLSLGFADVEVETEW